MTQRRRTHLRAAGVLLIPAALIVSGCSGGSGGDNGGGDGATSFTYAYSTSGDGTVKPWQEVMAEAYMKEHPDIKITLNNIPNDKYGDTLRTQLQAGNASDVLETAPGSGQTRSMIPLAEAGFLEPLGQYATDLIPSGQEKLYQIDGKTYGMANDFNVSAVVAGLGTAADNGIDDWFDNSDDLLAACDKLKGDGKSLFALAGAAGPNVGITATILAATRVYADEPDWNERRTAGEVTFADSQGWHDALDLFVKLNEDGCFQPGAQGAGFDVLSTALNGQTAVAGFLPSAVAQSLELQTPAANFEVVPFPPAKGGKPFIFAGSNYSLSVNAKSKAKQAAEDFVQWVGAPEQAQAFFDASGLLPAGDRSSIDLSKTVYTDVVPLLDSGSFVTFPPNEWTNLRAYDTLQSGVQGLLTGQKTVDQVLADLDTAWDS